MTPDVRPLVAGNWKMNGTQAALGELNAIARQCAALLDKIDILICPPATLIRQAVETLSDNRLAIGGQDCHPASAGAFTGEISAPMLADCGARYVILGHSERRTLFGETDGDVRAKTQATWSAGLVAIVCVGETADEKKGNRTLEIIGRQIAGSVPDGATASNTVIAYEPVWAIGTGLTPTADDVEAAHRHMRSLLIERFQAEGKGMRLLYGGSVKGSNAAELMGIENVDGALVGGASLRAADFLAIAGVYGNQAEG